jgi:CRISP-associated protein Cas1
MNAIANQLAGSVDYMPARMINELVYCQRLFYLMHVEGQFEHNADTEDGILVHRVVDARVDPLPPGASGTGNVQGLLPGLVAATDSKTAGGKEETRVEVHARSVTLGSDRLGVVAKMDLVEADGDVATPVDYKKGRPRITSDGKLAAWDPERVQLCLQGLILREHGYTCREGILYFASSRQRVRVVFDDALVDLAESAVAQARQLVTLESPPPPLVDSPKCPRCSLSAICLPDETNYLMAGAAKRTAAASIRLPSTPRDDLRPLYLNTQGLYVGLSGELLQVKEGGKVAQEVRLRDINQVNVYGNIQLTSQAIKELCEQEIPTVFHSMGGYFKGMVQGVGLRNILLRRAQFRLADEPAFCLDVARRLVSGKIRNQRVMLMRNHVEPPSGVIQELKVYAKRAERADSLPVLLGIEGSAARRYFEYFSGMLKPGDEPVDPLNALGEPPIYRFDFRGRNRRPPRDPVNAMLSLCYSLLSKDLTVTAASVGFDPFLGFFHVPRPGRPALSLDLMEPFRPIIADSVVLMAVNNRMVTPEHFHQAGCGVEMTDSGRKSLFRAYETRMDQLVTHPMFDYRVSYRRLLEIQTRMLARVVQGELGEYPVFVTR